MIQIEGIRLRKPSLPLLSWCNMCDRCQSMHLYQMQTTICHSPRYPGSKNIKHLLVSLAQLSIKHYLSHKIFHNACIHTDLFCMYECKTDVLI